jgi:TRAP-type C4-dicarboxylate transport system permease small subunit
MVSLVDAASRWLAKLSVALAIGMFAAMLAALTYQVIARYFFNAPPTWTEEFSLAMFTWIVLLMGSVGVREGFHVLLDLWPSRLPAWLHATLTRGVQGLTLIVGLVLLQSGWAYVADTQGQVSAAITYPIEALHAAAPVCGLLMAVHTLAALLKSPPAQDVPL